MPYSDPQTQRAYLREYRLVRRAEFDHRERVADYLRSHPCIDCGENDPIVLDFDHRDPATKRFNVSRRTTASTAKWETLLAEIEKCDVVCANCHRVRTFNRRAA